MCVVAVAWVGVDVSSGSSSSSAWALGMCTLVSGVCVLSVPLDAA